MQEQQDQQQQQQQQQQKKRDFNLLCHEDQMKIEPDLAELRIGSLQNLTCKNFIKKRYSDSENDIRYFVIDINNEDSSTFPKIVTDSNNQNIRFYISNVVNSNNSIPISIPIKRFLTIKKIFNLHFINSKDEKKQQKIELKDYYTRIKKNWEKDYFKVHSGVKIFSNTQNRKKWDIPITGYKEKIKRK